MFRHFGLLADWIIDHRWFTFFTLVAWTILMAIGHYDPYLVLPERVVARQNADAIAAEDDEFNRAPTSRAPKVSPIQVTSGDVIVVARANDFFSQRGANAMRDVVAALEQLDHVNNVLWMDRAPMINIFGRSYPCRSS